MGKTATDALVSGLSQADQERSRTLRTWARENDFAVAERGRILEEVVTAYDKAPAAKPVKPVHKTTPRKKSRARA